MANDLRAQPHLLWSWHDEAVRAETEVVEDSPSRLWIPETNDPQSFVDFHCGNRQLIQSAERRANRDLAHLQVRLSSDARVFATSVRHALSQTGFFNVIRRSLDAGLADDQVYDRFCTACGFEPADPISMAYWRVASGWLLYFFPDRFEMRPTKLTFGSRKTDYGTYG